MKISVKAHDRLWLEIPQEFPTVTDVDADAWEDRVVAGMREVWEGALTAEVEPVVREALKNALRRRLPEDAVTLQFWPGASIVNAIVHIVVSPFAEGESRSKLPLDSGPYVVDPVSELIETEYLGTGIESRALQRLSVEPPVTLGTVAYLFTNDHGFVFVGSELTLPAVVGAIIEPLREVVRSIRVLDDEAGNPWSPSEATQTDIPSRGEEWDAPTVLAQTEAGSAA